MADTIILTNSQITQIRQLFGNQIMSGSEISRVLSRLGIVDNSGQSTKWCRLEYAFTERQRQDHSGNAILRFIQEVLSPVNYVQSYYDNDRNIIIVSNNITNKQQINGWLENREFNTLAEKYSFYSILADELARIMIREKSRADKIAISSDPDEFFRVISEEKDKMYKKLLKSFEGK